MKFQYKLLTILFTAVALVGFFACDDAPQITKPIIDEILTQPIPVTQSPYTGRLIQIGPSGFGLSLDSPTAIEWNGENLYMIATQGKYRNATKYLWILDRHTGVITHQFPAADLGGSFKGRGFTQVLYVNPNDMTWIPQGPHGRMIGVCGTIDAIVGIDLETGMALRGSWKKDYCLRNEFDEQAIGGGSALAWDGKDLWMWGQSVVWNHLFEEGRFNFGQLYRFLDSGTICVEPIGQPHKFSRPHTGVNHISALTFDGKQMYGSGGLIYLNESGTRIGTDGLFRINRQTGDPHFIARWEFAELPPGVVISDKNIYHDISELTQMPADHDGTHYGYWNTEENFIFDHPHITGLAFDGIDIYAVEYFTNALYKLEKK